MGISYQFARGFVGQPVFANCVGGRRYYGVVRRVTPQFIYISPIRYGAGAVSSSESLEVITADQPSEAVIESASFGGWGFYPNSAITALALFDILAISLLWW